MSVQRGVFCAGVSTVCVLAVTMAAALCRAQGGGQETDLGLNGHCPAAYLLHGKAVKGDPAYQMVYQGLTYYFSSAEARKRFQEDPGKYHPRIGGLCTVALGGPYGNRFPGDPEVFDVLDGKVYLLSSERARNSYVKKPREDAARAEQLWAEPELRGICLVSYHTAGKPVRGDAKFKVVYKRKVYHLASAEAKKMFEDDPEKYVPQYDGLCTEGVSRGKRFKGPTAFAVYKGKTYLFWDENAKRLFEADPEGMVKKANAEWVTLRDEK